MKLTKQQQLEKTAQKLFFKHGFKKVSIEELCNKATVSRKTFYTFYDNKNALVLELMHQLMDEGLQQYQDIINEDILFSVKMEKALQMKYSMSKQFTVEFIEDVYNSEVPELLEYIKSASANSIELTRQMFIQAKSKGELNPDLNIDYAMWLLGKYQEIINSHELMTMFPNAEALIRQISDTFVYGVMKR
jgi:AcrR family transcriptional regulator